MFIIRVNMSSQKVTIEDVDSKWQKLGGRALVSQIMIDEVQPNCDPLGEDNKIIIAPGLLAGTTVSCVNRISIGGKSPLTGTIKESNAGGTTAYKLARLGVKAIILEGLSTALSILYISKGEIELKPAEELCGVGVYGTAEALKEKYGKNIGLVINGPTGEKRCRAAGIANADNDGVPSRFSGRGGLGAVLGSKGIKAIVIDDRDVPGVTLSDEVGFNNLKKTISSMILSNEAVANSYTKFGTSNLVKFTDSIGALPTRNFSRGSFEGADGISGQRIYDLIMERKGDGKPSHACMPGCLIRCSNVFPDENGKALVSPIEYETIGLLGSNLSISDIDIVAKLNYMCNDLGLDTIEMGGAIGVAMEAGVIEFGDGDGAVSLLDEVRNNTYLGRVLASGASITGKVLGVTRIPVSKDQTMAAYEPRAIKGLGVTYATSPQGADHTAGQTLRAQVDHRKPEKQVETSRAAQIGNTMHDSIGTCFFVGGAIGGNIKLLADLYCAMTGEILTVDDFMQIAKDTLKRERKFNEAAGFNQVHDRLPEFFYKEINPDTGTVFDVEQEELNSLFEF